MLRHTQGRSCPYEETRVQMGTESSKALKVWENTNEIHTNHKKINKLETSQISNKYEVLKVLFT